MKLGLQRGEKGFTLIEIIIVLAVLGVLAAIVVPNVTGYLAKAKERAWETDQRILKAAVAGWRGDVKKHTGNPYPTIGSQNGSVGGTIGDPADANGDGKFTGASDNNTFIDIKLLADEGYLEAVDSVKSAWVDATNLGTTNTNSPSGSYAWYIDSHGIVQAWYPRDDTLGTAGAVDIDASEKGFQSGVYP